MQCKFFITGYAKWWPILIGALLLILLSVNFAAAQAGTGTLIVNACIDQNANGLCASGETELAADGVEACLEDDGGGLIECLPAPATFSDLALDTYTVYLSFGGEAAGYYPTSGRTPVNLAQGGQLEVDLGAVYPVHPKGVAVHESLNKVYVAFQGPIVDDEKPYPFVAVIDGETDEVLYTIPGGEEGLVDPSPHAPNFAGIGRGPWGVAVSGDGQFVYTGSFEDGLVTYINPVSDTALTNYFAGTDFMPTAPSVNPVTGLVHFPDYEQGRMLILSTDPNNAQVAFPFIENPPVAFSPFEMVTATALGSYNFVTLRDALQPNPFKFVGLSSADPFNVAFHDIVLPGGGTGVPHALGLWQDTGQNRLFITYADDPRTVPNPPSFINPDKLLVYEFVPDDPSTVTLVGQTDLERDYAEAGLVYNPDAGHMLGTYAGFAYDDRDGHVAACDSSEQGGIYQVDFDGNVSAGPQPDTVVGNPPLADANLQWSNPFEIAINPNNGKIYVTDRCWNDYPESNQPGGGAVLIFQDTDVEPTPTPTVTVTITPTVTVTPTTTPTATTTPEPNQLSLVMNGPAAVEPGEVFSVTVEAQNVPDPGLYGVQFQITYDPDLISVDNLQVNPALSLVVLQDADNLSGTITLLASRQGPAPGLSSDVTLLTFEATAANVAGTAILSFENAKIGDAEANAFSVATEDYTVIIGDATPEPTVTITPTTTPTTTPEPTDEPTATITPTTTPTTTTTPEPTDEPTVTPTPTTTTTPEPTDEPTTTPTATPTPAPTDEPGAATISGQVILAGRADNDWSDASVTVDDSSQSATTNAAGNFTITNVVSGTHTSITADAAGYLSAVCTGPALTAPLTNLLPVTLTSGDINGDDVIDIADATAIGAGFGATGPGLPADINQDEIVDVFDLILVSINYGENGPQTWSCQ